VVLSQFADSLICKTRYLSLYHQGLRNPIQNGSLLFMILLACFLLYVPAMHTAFGTRSLRFVHWLPALPFFIIIIVYDEVRKYWMRTPKGNWLERFTYY